MNGLITAQFLAFLVGAFVIFVGLVIIRLRKPKNIKIADRILLDQEQLAITESLREIELQESIAKKESKLTWLEKKQLELAQSNTGITFPVYIILAAISMLIIFLIVYKITSFPILAIPCSFIGLKIPDSLVSARIKQNVDKFNNDMVKALRRMASVMRSGGSLKQALADVTRSRSMPLIIRIEFKKVLTDIEYGDTIEKALYKLYERIGSKDVRFLAIAVEIQRQLGGNIAQIFDNIGQTISNRNVMQSEVKATLVQAKTSATILSLMPFFLGGTIFLLNPNYFAPLFETLMGRMVVFVCLIFIVTGVFVMRKMSHIEL